MSARNDLDFSIRSIMLATVVSVLPALAMLAVIGVADLTIDGWDAALVTVCAVAGMFAGDAALARTASGAAQRSARTRLFEALDATESRARDFARYGPIAFGFCCMVVADTEIGGLALGTVVTFPLAQLAFAVWLHNRRRGYSPAPTS